MREDTNSTNTIVPSLDDMNIAMNNENINRVLNWHGINQMLNIIKQSHCNDPSLCYRQFISYESGSIVISNCQAQLPQVVCNYNNELQFEPNGVDLYSFNWNRNTNSFKRSYF